MLWIPRMALPACVISSATSTSVLLVFVMLQLLANCSLVDNATEGVSLLQRNVQSMHATFGKANLPSILEGESQSSSETKNNSVGDVVTLFSTECGDYHNWQSVTLFHSWKNSELPGQLVRLLACPAGSEELNKALLYGFGESRGMTTFVHEPAPIKHYSPNNRPYGILLWLRGGPGKDLRDDAIILVLDPDMVFYGGALSKIMPIIEPLRTGQVQAVATDYGYPVAGMRAQNWQVPKHFNVTNMSALQGLGVPMLHTKRSLGILSQGYYDYCQEIAHNATLVSLVHDGRNFAPWIVEMYGYSIAAREMQHETQIQWPVFDVPQPPWSSIVAEPLVVHYSHTFHLCNRTFGKSNFHSDSMYPLACKRDGRPGFATTLMQMLQPPSPAEAADDTCQLCLDGNDVLGWGNTCFPADAKRHALHAWTQVFEATREFRALFCDLELREIAS